MVFALDRRERERERERESPLEGFSCSLWVTLQTAMAIPLFIAVGLGCDDRLKWKSVRGGVLLLRWVEMSVQTSSPINSSAQKQDFLLL
jgi:hypothetical protein